MEHGATHSGHNKYLTGGALAVGGVIAAPYVLPMVGFGTFNMTAQAAQLCSASTPIYGTGLVGAINTGLSHIPLVGESLAVGALGSWSAALITGGLSIGGLMLGKYMEKNYDPTHRVPWGKIIKYTTLATSLLIALPSILSGLSMGLTFLAFAGATLFAGAGAGAIAASNTYSATNASLGMMGGLNTLTAGKGIIGLLPHLLTCGAAAFPFIGSLLAKKEEKEPEMPKLELPATSWAQRVQAPQPQGHAPAL